MGGWACGGAPGTRIVVPQFLQRTFFPRLVAGTARIRRQVKVGHMILSRSLEPVCLWSTAVLSAIRDVGLIVGVKTPVIRGTIVFSDQRPGFASAGRTRENHQKDLRFTPRDHNGSEE